MFNRIYQEFLPWYPVVPPDPQSRGTKSGSIKSRFVDKIKLLAVHIRRLATLKYRDVVLDIAILVPRPTAECCHLANLMTLSNGP